MRDPIRPDWMRDTSAENLSVHMGARRVHREAEDRDWRERHPQFVLLDANGNEINRKPALASKWGWYADINSPAVKAVALVQPEGSA